MEHHRSIFYERCFHHHGAPDEYVNGAERDALEDQRQKRMWDYFYRADRNRVGMDLRLDMLRLESSAIDSDNLARSAEEHAEAAARSKTGLITVGIILLAILALAGVAAGNGAPAVIGAILFAIFGGFAGARARAASEKLKEAENHRKHAVQTRGKSKHVLGRIDSLIAQIPAPPTDDEFLMMREEELHALEARMIDDLAIEDRIVHFGEDMTRGYTGIPVFSPASIQSESSRGRQELAMCTPNHTKVMHYCGGPGVAHYAAIAVQFTFLTGDQIGLYQCFYDCITGEVHARMDRTVYYEDITAIETYDDSVPAWYDSSKRIKTSTCLISIPGTKYPFEVSVTRKIPRSDMAKYIKKYVARKAHEMSETSEKENSFIAEMESKLKASGTSDEEIRNRKNALTRTLNEPSDTEELSHVADQLEADAERETKGEWEHIVRNIRTAVMDRKHRAMQKRMAATVTH